MSETTAKYSFLPWLREGLSNKIEATDTLGSSSGTVVERARMDAHIVLTHQKTDGTPGGENTAQQELQLVGPGDVLGINQQAIVRTEPKNQINNFEANLLPYIEFFEEQFPWLYTPARPDGQKLRPWIALVVMKEDEFSITNAVDGPSYFTLRGDAYDNALPKESDIWAFAHVQVNKLINTTSSDTINTAVKQAIDSNPDEALSRIIATRKLEKNTGYQAFLIPTFETGRVGGLGGDTSAIKAQEPAWKSGDGATLSSYRAQDFPFYYTWEFQTGAHGDFETLVSILRPRIANEELGSRPMDIQDPGYGLKERADTTELGLEGALKPIDFEAQAFSQAGDIDFKNHLKELLNLGMDLEYDPSLPDSITHNPFFNKPLDSDPIITPPVYGQWHALIERLGDPNNQAWIEHLNLDPRNRAVAGLGTESVKQRQENLMKDAWEQIGEINEANKRIREAELVALLGRSMYQRNVQGASEDKLMDLTASMNKTLFLANGQTSFKRINASVIPNASQEGAFKKIVRPGAAKNKKLNKEANSPEDVIHKQLTTRFNLFTNAENPAPKAITTAVPLPHPQSAVESSTISTAIATAVSEFEASAEALAQEWLFNVVERLAQNVLQRAAMRFEVTNSTHAAKPSLAAAIDLAKDAVDNITVYSKNGHVIDVTISKDAFEALFGTGVTAKAYRGVTLRQPATANSSDFVGSATTLSAIRDFGQKFSQFNLDRSQQLASLEPPQPITNFTEFSDDVKTKLNPSSTICKRVMGTLNVPESIGIYDKEKLKPIMSYPRFDAPVFRYLQAISLDYIIPNIDQIPDNTLMLMESNPAFIESYMAGLNHEMSRELLWREFPTDQRGSYFRRFWDVKDNIQEADESRKFDIKEMHTWDDQLGAHSPRIRPAANGDAPASDYLVLVIKGDVLEKYPNTLVYAQKAVFQSTEGSKDATKPRRLAPDNDMNNFKFPVFQADLAKNISIFGFDLSAEEAKGSVEVPLKEGWFFALRERPGQIKFGLDDYVDDDPNAEDPTNAMPPEVEAIQGNSLSIDSWNNLSWEHLVSSKAELLNFHLNFERGLTLTGAPANQPVFNRSAADLASILLQNPVLFARHGREMLPEDVD